MNLITGLLSCIGCIIVFNILFVIAWVKFKKRDSYFDYFDDEQE